MSHRDSAKIGIVGCGKVGMTTAFTLLVQGVANELVLVGRCKDDLVGEQLDLEHGLNFLHPTQIQVTDDYADLHGCDVVIITAGAAQQPGQTRLELAAANKKIISNMIPDILKYVPQAIILMVSNPVDVLTYHAYQLSGAKFGQIFGTGTTLDTSRFRFHLSEHLQVNPRSIHAYVLGEHGDTSFPVLSSANVGGQPLLSFPGMTEALAKDSYQKARDAAATIINSKGATFYAIGVVVTHIVKTILQDAKSVLPVTVPLTNYAGISDVALSVPCIVGRKGIEKVLEIPLNTEEKAQLHHSADQLRQFLKK